MPTTSPTFEVLILTYNGGQYIEELLISIIRQLPPQCKILISDDGSTDATLRLIEEISRKTEVRIDIIKAPGDGVIENFFYAVHRTTAEYIFVADQDDIWLPNKVSEFTDRMSQTSEPHLLFSDAYTWHPETDRRISFWREQHINPKHCKSLKTLLFRNCVQGASMAINRSLIEKLTHTPENAMMHDWWCALAASAMGHIEYIDTPTLLYRQHSSNQIGSNLKRTFAQKRQATRQIFKQAIEFSLSYGNELSETDQKMLNSFTKSIKGNILQRAIYLMMFRPIRSNTLKTLTLWASIILYDYRDSD